MQYFAQPYWRPAVTPSPEPITEVSDHRGTAELSVICTQLAGTHTPTHLDLPSSWRAEDIKLLCEALTELETGNVLSTGKAKPILQTDS